MGTVHGRRFIFACSWVSFYCLKFFFYNFLHLCVYRTNCSSDMHFYCAPWMILKIVCLHIGEFLQVLHQKLADGALVEKTIAASMVWALIANNQKGKVVKNVLELMPNYRKPWINCISVLLVKILKLMREFVSSAVSFKLSMLKTVQQESSDTTFVTAVHTNYS